MSHTTTRSLFNLGALIINFAPQTKQICSSSSGSPSSPSVILERNYSARHGEISIGCVSEKLSAKHLNILHNICLHLTWTLLYTFWYHIKFSWGKSPGFLACCMLFRVISRQFKHIRFRGQITCDFFQHIAMEVNLISWLRFSVDNTWKQNSLCS